MWVIRYIPVLLILKVLFAIAFCQSNDFDVRLIDNNNYYKYCVAAGKDLQSIMMWDNNPTVSYFEPNLENLRINCEFKANENCAQYWIGNGWVVKNSLELLLGPLLDRRWEGLSYYLGRKYSGEEEFTNNHNFNIQNGNNFEIPVSFKSNGHLHVFLCDGNSELKSNCYWIAIAGWGGDVTAIRKCKSNQIPAKNNVFSYPIDCKNTQKNMTHSMIFSKDRWNHIFVKKHEKNISVNLQDGRTLLEWTDGDDEIIVSKFIITLRSTGQFKVHEYNLIFTKEQSVKQMGKFDFKIGNTFCIAIFVKMCKKCKMILFLENLENGHQLEEKTFTTDGEWEEIYYFVNISAYENIQAYSFYIKTVAEGNAGNPFWAIGEVRACSSRDTRIIKFTGYEKRKCVIIRSNKPNQTIEIDSKPPTKSNRMEKCHDYSLKIGNSCYPFNTYSDRGSRICYFDKQQKQSMCYCSPGFHGQDCNTDCQLFYGYDCDEKCGQCNYDTCNKINGNCTYGCKDNFVGPTCKIGKYPVLRKLPKILKVAYFSIKLKLDSTDYDGEETAVAYKFLYRRKSTNYSALWSETVNFKWNDLSGKYIQNLTPSTVYEIKTLLIANDGKSDEENNPTFEVITNCDDLTRENIKIESISNISVKLIVKDTLQNCHLSLYEITMGSERVTFVNKMYSRNDLEPYRQYKIIFKRSNMDFTFDFRTEEGIPGDVTDLKLDNQKPSSISIAWMAPEKPNGKIENYNIYYRLIRNIKCWKEISNSPIVTQMSRSTFYTIENLKPYSVYQVGVSAKTSAGEAKTVMRRFNTTPADTLLKNEITELNIKTNSNNADIIIKMDCFNSGGELYYHIKGYCSDSWCKPSKDLTYDNKNIITNLIPFSNYTINISIYRQYYNKIISSMDRNFLTTASQPNKMTGVSDYSKTESSVSLRWKPSFPPNGIIEKFRITWWRGYNNPTYLDVEPVRCKIWDDYYCYNLTNLNSMTTYTVTISGKNKMVNGYSTESALHRVKTITELPQVPENPRITFDDNNNLISSWMHPDNINGPLKEIIITLEDKNRNILYNAKYTEDFEKLNFTKKINLSEKGWRNDLAIAGFRACNSFGCSDSARVRITLPPELPSFHGEVLTEATKNSAKIILPKLTHYNNKYYLIITNFNQHSDIDEELIRKLKQKCNISAIENGWSVITQNLKDSKITIGKDINDSDININIKPNTNYEACIVLLNEKNNIQRFSARRVKFTTPTQPEEITDTNYGLLALLLFLLLPAVAIWIYASRKKRAKSQTKMEINFYDEPVLPGQGEVHIYEEPLPPVVQDENIYEVPNDPNEKGEYLSPEDIENQYKSVVNFLEGNIVAGNVERTYISVHDVDYKYDYVVDLLAKVTDPVYANLQNNSDESTQLVDERSRLRTCLSEIKDRLVQAQKDLKNTDSTEKNKEDMLKTYLSKELKEIYERIQHLHTTMDSNK